MKSRHFFFAILIFLPCFVQAAEMDDVRSFHLDVIRPPPKPGDEIEKVAGYFSTTTGTKLLNEREVPTNAQVFESLKGRERILNWDARNGLAKVEMVIDRLLSSRNYRTNELVKPGTRVIGNAIAGQMFFRSEDAPLSMEARRVLGESCTIRPSDPLEYGFLKLTQPRSIGERWEAESLPNPTELTDLCFDPRLQPLLENVNTINSTVYFVGKTNVFGLSCFHLQIESHVSPREITESLRRIMMRGNPGKAEFQMNIVDDLIWPFDLSQRLVMKIHSSDAWVSGEATVDGTNISFHVRTSLRSFVEFRPVQKH